MLRRTPLSPSVRAALLPSVITLLGTLAPGASASVAPLPAAAQGLKQSDAPLTAWEVKTFPVADVTPQIRVTLTEIEGSGADLYLRLGAAPTLTEYDAVSKRAGTSNEEIVLGSGTKPPLESGLWYVGILRPG